MEEKSGGAQPSAAVTVEDQEGDGMTVTVPGAEISGSTGWVAIHLDNGGKPLVPQTEGQALIQEGANEDVVVTLDTPLTESQKIYAMIHTDRPPDGNYRFPVTAKTDKPEDPPVKTGSGDIVVKPFEYTVSGASESGSLPKSGGVGVPALAWVAGAAALLAVTGGLFVRRLH